MAEPDIICEQRGAAGFVTLNRPKALNALTPAMTRTLAAALAGWARDDSVQRVVIRGAGERAFCAGGDIRLIYDQGLAGDHAAQVDFWREEYILNRTIQRYPKPYVAMIDGFVMGGGAGVSIHGSHRVAGDRLAFAMPEVNIGFFPDVGATYFLPRLPGGCGAWIALTGARIGPGDACELGLASAFVPSDAHDALAQALGEPGDTDAIIARFVAAPPIAALQDRRATIDACFRTTDLRALLGALSDCTDRGDAFAADTLADLRGKSPTSVAIALRQMSMGSRLSIEEALRVEYRIVSRICRSPDLYEGIRAAIIDRKSPPNWRPARFEQLEVADIDRFFEPLGPDELTFPELGSW